MLGGGLGPDFGRHVGGGRFGFCGRGRGWRVNRRRRGRLHLARLFGRVEEQLLRFQLTCGERVGVKVFGFEP